MGRKEPFRQSVRLRYRRLRGFSDSFLTEFSEIRYRKQLPSDSKDKLNGRYATPSKLCNLPPLANRGGVRNTLSSSAPL
jgi:hypothetical protein